MTQCQGMTRDEIWDAIDHRIKPMRVGETVGLRTKQDEGKEKWGGTPTDAHNCAGISDVRLEEEVIHMVWLGRMQSGEQRRSSNWKEKGSS